ncbi:MAG: DUF4012 domain-containing protein [Candidatus Magasanikbacteria bacterium]|nr:DUF4012 domain-containing protein [Candidatus Magasanikbacteria bacterium]
MPRRKKSAQSKPILISFLREETPSPHILNLRETLAEPAEKTIEWKPNAFERVLSQPLSSFKSPATEIEDILEEKPMVVEQGVFFDSDDDEEELEVGAVSRWKMPDFNFSLPRISLPNISWPQWPQFSLPVLRPAFAFKHAGLYGFVLFALVLTLPLPAFSTYASLRKTQNQIIQLGTEAFNHLESGQSALLAKDMIGATKDLQTALDLFSQTQKELKGINPILRAALAVIPGVRQKYLNGEHLMMAGTNLSVAALPLIQAADVSLDKPLSEQLEHFDAILTQVAPRFKAVAEHLQQVDASALPDAEQEKFLSIRDKVEWLASDLEKIQPLLANLSMILGGDSAKRYLLIFQNDTELRPTGGFIGSFALLDVDKGKIKKLDLPGGGSYEMQGALKAAILPPPPLQLLKARWEFQDANWFPDFPTSAKKIMWFYEKGGGPTVDGVLAFDTRLFIDLLKITGPIEMSEYGLTVDEQNFVAVTQKQVEIDYDKTENKPKQFLADLAPKVIEKLLNNTSEFLPLLGALNKNLAERHLQMYFSNDDLEKFFIDSGWAGKLKDNPQGDYLAVINTNIAGGKTDGVIKQTINHQAKIEVDGSIVNVVTITREHQGRPGDVFTDWQNVGYLRLYAPEGSRLIKADGFTYPEEKLFKVAEKWYKLDEDLQAVEQEQTIDETSGTIITKEFGKTSFGNWVMTKPGQTTTVSFTYRLPFKLLNNSDYLSYSLLAQKQAGRVADGFFSHISIPTEWQVVWRDPAEIELNGNQLNYSTDLREDKYFGFVIKR